MGWLGTWAYRLQLQIDSTNIDAELTNFPILVHLSASCGIGGEDMSAVFDELTSDANRFKIAVTIADGSTETKVEIEQWDDGNEEAWLWVLVPTIASGADTILYLYYDVSESDNTTNIGDIGSTPGQAVWDANFAGVWHMNQDPEGDSQILHAAEVSDTGDPAQALQAFGPHDCTGLTKANAYLVIDLKCDDPSNISASPPTTLELTSSGTYDDEEWAYTLTAEDLARLDTAYKTFIFPMTYMVSTGELVVSEIDYIRWWGFGDVGNVTLSWQNAKVLWDGGVVKESTSNGNHGIPAGTMLTEDLVTGQIDNGLHLDGGDDTVIVSDDDTFDSTNITVEVIVNPDSVAATANIVDHVDYVGANDNGGFVLGTGLSEAGDYFMNCYNDQVYTASHIDTATGAFKYIGGTYDGTDIKLFIDHEKVDTENQASALKSSVAGDVKISNSGAPFDGIVDEIRISKTARSEAWMKASYYSNFDALITFVAVVVYTLECAAGSYALTGTEVNFKWDHKLTAGAGSYALTGTAAALYRIFTLTAGAGSYALTGSDATLSVIAILILLNSIIDQEITLDSEIEQEETFASLIEQETTLISQLIKIEE